MNFAIILAAGSGTRIKSADVPKQFLELQGETLLESVVDKFLCCEEIDQIIVAVPEIWLEHSRDILKHKSQRVHICTGGKTRQESLYKSALYIRDNFKITEKDKIISHDVARPFVTLRIIRENISALDKYRVVDTIIPATDTIVCSENGADIKTVPERKNMYLGQTPQSFFCLDYIKLYENLGDDYLNSVTDAVKIFVDNGYEVGIVNGSVFNIKITSDFDLLVANFLVGRIND